jgi:metal-responsive CopG/Arc/MetJ family transcriptional regulator
MSATSKKAKAAATKEKGNAMPATKSRAVRAGRERVLVEFPLSLLQRADEAASELAKNRSELIRTAVEHLLEEMEKKKFEIELATAYAANAQMNVDMSNEFTHVDNEGFS